MAEAGTLRRYLGVQMWAALEKPFGPRLRSLHFLGHGFTAAIQGCGFSVRTGGLLGILTICSCGFRTIDRTFNPYGLQQNNPLRM